METDTIITLVLVIGIVLNVFAIGLRSRLHDPVLLLRKPALGLKAMAAMYLAVPLFTLAVTRLFPLQQGVGAVLLGLAVSPMLPPWAKTGTKIGGHEDYVFGLQVLATCISIFVVPVMILLVAWTFGMEVTFDPFRFSMVLLITVGLPLALGMAATKIFPNWSQRIAGGTERIGNIVLLLGVVALLVTSRSMILGAIGNGTLAVIVAFIGFALLAGHWLGGPDPGNRGALATATASRHPGIALLLASGVFPDHGRIILGTVLLYLLATITLTIPYQRWRCQVLARGTGGNFS
jgi:bile acid:Na+ symporter, BASS family